MSSLPRTSGIYRITCTVNNKIYIGSAVDLSERWHKHQYAWQRGNHANRHLQNAYNKYGAASFVCDVIETCNRDTLVERENYYLTTLAPFSPNGFNIAMDATRPRLGLIVTDETRQKLSIAGKGRKPSLETNAKISASKIGKKASDETRAILRIALKGRVMPTSHKEKLSARMKGVAKSPEHRAKTSASLMGHKMTDANREKLLAANTGRKQSPEERSKRAASNAQKWVVTTPEGIEINVVNLHQFCRDNGLRPSGMVEVANGRLKSYKKWKCRHADF